MELLNEVVSICRTATQCNVCFEDGSLSRGYIGVAQPRPIGPKYATTVVKVAVLMINPGKGQNDDNHREGEKQIRAFSEGLVPISDVFRRQVLDFPNWGRGGKFMSFYEALGLDFEEITFVNLAWCSEIQDKYPRQMLAHCLHRHTLPLLRALDPDVVLACGSQVADFKRQIAAALPRARVIQTLHFAHREGREIEAEQTRRVRDELRGVRSARPQTGRS